MVWCQPTKVLSSDQVERERWFRAIAAHQPEVIIGYVYQEIERYIREDLAVDDYISPDHCLNILDGMFNFNTPPNDLQTLVLKAREKHKKRFHNRYVDARTLKERFHRHIEKQFREVLAHTNYRKEVVNGQLKHFDTVHFAEENERPCARGIAQTNPRQSEHRFIIRTNWCSTVLRKGIALIDKQIVVDAIEKNNPINFGNKIETYEALLAIQPPSHPAHSMRNQRIYIARHEDGRIWSGIVWDTLNQELLNAGILPIYR